MILPFVLPFLYCFLAGTAWAMFFKKRFLDALAPALMAHIVLVLLSGLLFGRLSVGIYAGPLFFAVLLVAAVRKQNKDQNAFSLRGMMTQEWTQGLFLFCIIYLFIFITNSGKRFLYYDEYTHWGIFLRESLRMDAFYCESPLSFAHKDYVPATTLFEVIWCRLCARFHEADAYRAIQMLMFSMLMPMLRPLLAQGEGRSARIRHYAKQLSGLAFLILLPLLFLGNQHYFYHSIYCDMFMGVAFFYCVFYAYQNEYGTVADTVALTLGCVTMVMSKMIAVVFLPLIALYLIARRHPLPAAKSRKPRLLSNIISLTALPLMLWAWFNRYVDAYVPNDGFIQSYDGMSPGKLFEVFGLSSAQTIPHLSQVRDAYFSALLQRPVFLKFSYVIVLLVSAALIFLMARLQKGEQRRANLLTACFVLLSGIFYALLMYFLYATAFSEEEALHLASFDRYMASFALGIVLCVVAVYFLSLLETRDWRGLVYKILFLVGALLLGLYPYHVQCLLPGFVTRDEAAVAHYDLYAARIDEYVPEDASVFMIERGDPGDLWAKMRYYAAPHVTWAESIGPPVDEADVWSGDYTPDEFVELVSRYDYLYLIRLDEAFLDKYSGCFTDADKLTDGAIYKRTIVDGKIVLE